MTRFTILERGLDVAPLAAELAAQPELWDRDLGRTWFPESPFAGTSDIWARAVNREAFYADPTVLTRPHFCEWWPAWERLPALHGIVDRLISKLRPHVVGTILVTRIPPGGHIAPHADRSWMPEFFTDKLHVSIASNPGCVNRSVEEEFVAATGDVFTFDNTLEHEVWNHGETDRLTAIVSMRRDR